MASFGEELRRQRELRSVTLREISDATKINIRFLEALEENDFKHLPGGQFNKGFIRAYARHIGVDGEDMVNAYILEVRRQDDEHPSGRASSTRAQLDPADRRALIALGVLAVLVVLLALGIWSLFFRGRTGAKAAAPAAPASATETRPQAPDPAVKKPSGAAGTTGASGAAEAPAEATSPPAAETPGGAPAKESVPPVSQDQARTAVAAAATGDMALRVVPLKSVRLELLCDGKESYSGTLELGRPLSFSCSGVYEVTVEDAGAVNLSINGDRIYIGRPGQSIAGRHVSRANLPDFLNPPFEPGPR